MEIAAMTTERSSYTDVFRQWVETSEKLNDRLDELRPINMQIDDGNHDPTVLAANSRLQDEIGRLHERRDELNAELIRLTAAGSV
jgi:uncharacterized protein YukE